MIDEPTMLMRHVSGASQIVMPTVNMSASSMLHLITKISFDAGEPLGVDLSSALREATVSLPAMAILLAWCEAFGVMPAEPADVNPLGTVTVQIGGSDRWTLRLLCATPRT